MNSDTRNMKKVCSLLHDTRHRGHDQFNAFELEMMIRTAEEIYHRMKEQPQ